MSLPEHSRRVAERLLGAYCQRICPPEFREQVVLGFRETASGGVAGAGAAPLPAGFTLHEIRRICGVPGTARLVDVAQLRYEARRGVWRLYYAIDALREQTGTRPPRWVRYPGTGAERNLAVLMRALDADALGLLWPRVNGASLRWCSSRGRCEGCSARYRAVLGGADAPAVIATAECAPFATEHRAG